MSARKKSLQKKKKTTKKTNMNAVDYFNILIKFQ